MGNLKADKNRIYYFLLSLLIIFFIFFYFYYFIEEKPPLSDHDLHFLGRPGLITYASICEGRYNLSSFLHELFYPTPAGHSDLFGHIYGILLYLFGGSYLSFRAINAIFLLLLLIGTAMLTYAVTKNRKAVLFSVFLVATFPVIVNYSRTFRPHFVAAAFFPFILLCFIKSENFKNRLYCSFLGFLLGVLFYLHYSTLVYCILIMVYPWLANYFPRKNGYWKDILPAKKGRKFLVISLLLVPIVTLLYGRIWHYDFSMIKVFSLTIIPCFAAIFLLKKNPITNYLVALLILMTVLFPWLYNSARQSLGPGSNFSQSLAYVIYFEILRHRILPTEELTHLPIPNWWPQGIDFPPKDIFTCLRVHSLMWQGTWQDILWSTGQFFQPPVILFIIYAFFKYLIRNREDYPYERLMMWIIFFSFIFTARPLFIGATGMIQFAPVSVCIAVVISAEIFRERSPNQKLSISKRAMGCIGFLLLAQQVLIILYSLNFFDISLFRSRALAKILNIRLNDSPYPFPNTIGEVIIYPYQDIARIGTSTWDLSVFLTKIDKKKWATDRILRELKEILDKENKKIALVFINPPTFYPVLLLFSDYSSREKIVSFNDVGMTDLSNLINLSLDIDSQVLYMFTHKPFLGKAELERLFSLKKQQFQQVSVLRNDYGAPMMYVYKMTVAQKR